MSNAENGRDSQGWVEYAEALSPYPLKPLLIEITLSRSRAIADHIRAIDLGQIGAQDAEEILTESLRDPNGEEIGRDIYVTPNGHLYIRENSYHGERIEREKAGIISQTRMINHGTTVYINPLFERIPRDVMPNRQDRYWTAIIHSHGVLDGPPSPADLRRIFYRELDPHSQSLVFVISPARKILVFRGPHTPEWDRNYIDQKIVAWDQMIHEHTNLRLRLSFNKALHVQIEINRREQDEWLRSMALKYGLRVYACPSWENIAVYQDPHDRLTFLQVDREG